MEKDIVRRLRTVKEVYVLFSNATHCPYVVCDEDTADDEIFVYFIKTTGEAERNRLRDEGYSVALVTVKNDQFLGFYTSLYTMGINALEVSEKGGFVRIQLADIVRRKLPDAQKDGHVWVENPQLHLTALYLMQELRKNGQSGITPEQTAMFEEISADLAEATLIQPVLKEEKAVPMMQLKGGEKFQPLFTDILEFNKFNSENQFRPLIVQSSELKKIILPEAAGILINPRGVNMPLKMEK